MLHARTTSLSIGLIIPLLCLLPGAGRCDETTYNLKAVDGYILPGYTRLAVTTEQLAKKITSFCQAPNEYRLSQVQEAYHLGMDSWQFIQVIRFGPIEHSLRSYRIQFWPDKRQSVNRHLARLLEKADPDALEPRAFAKGSVALQGFNALERLLFDTDTQTKEYSQSGTNAYHCRLMQAITRNMADIAKALLSDWEKDNSSHRALIASAAQGNQTYADSAEVSARADRQRRYFASGIDAEGRLLFDLRLPARAHAIALHPERDTAVAIARRPGTFLQAIDLQTGRLLERIESLGERHFYGHGVFSHDGRYLYTTENSIETGRGTIGVREVESGYRLVDEFDSGGIGPHELCLMPDQRTLVVANGGIRTHPDFDRTPLNLTSMQPCLTYIDRTNGKHLETTRLPDRLHQNSIRHLAVGESGRVWIAMQYQGTKEMTPPLVAMHRRGHPLRLLMPPQAVLTAMRNYCGSVCADLSGHLFAVSSPRGNLVSFWSEEGDYLNSVHIKDGCGIASARSPGEFLLSSVEGGLYLYSIRTDELRRLANSPKEDFAWDNHLTNLLL